MKHPKNPMLSDSEFSQKMENVGNSYTEAEILEDKLIEVKGLLVACRDGHGHTLSFDDAIIVLDDCIERASFES